MSSWLVRTIIVAAFASTAGCTVYFGGDDDPCKSGDILAPEVAFNELRNPDNGLCQPFGGYPNPCGYDTAKPLLPRPDWAECNLQCEKLDEKSCSADPGCRPVYVASCPADVTCIESALQFAGCWGIAPTGPDLSRECAGLDAYACSRHNNCAAVYENATGRPFFDDTWQFLLCQPEASSEPHVCIRDGECAADERCKREDECWPPPGCGGDIPCPPVCYGICVPEKPPSCTLPCPSNSHCELQCEMDKPPPPGDTDPPMKNCQPVCMPDSSCDDVDCGIDSHCEVQCKPLPCKDGRCDGEICGPVCVPGDDDPGSCTGPVLCDALPPACPAGTKPGIRNGCWTGYCIPSADCSPRDPGDCRGAVLCRQIPPACPIGTKPGILNGCWTGYCIPERACEPAPVPSCGSLTTERACAARMDCQPLYQGIDCTCFPDGSCKCADRIFARCELR